MMSVSQSVTSGLEYSTNESMPLPLPADNIEVPFKFQVLIVSFSAFGIPGNIGAILVLLSDVHLRQKVVNIFMIHQSLIDLCGCICTLLTAIITDASLVAPGLTQELYCRVFLTKSLMWGVMHASGYNLTYLTLERYWAMTKPLKYDHEKVKKRLWYILPSAWILGLLSLFPNFSTSRMVDGFCFLFIDIKSPTLLRMTTPYYISISCFIPAIIMFYAYGAIFLTLRKSSSFQSKGDQQTAPNQKLRRAQINLLQTCVILMVMFVLCWLQLAIVFMLFTVGYFKDLYTDYFHIANVCLILNSCLNPYVYSVRYKEFQDQLKYLLCPGASKQKDQQIVSTASMKETTAH